MIREKTQRFKEFYFTKLPTLYKIIMIGDTWEENINE